MNRQFQPLSKALQPLVARAEALDCRERRAWLADLHRECPTVAKELEQLLAPHHVMEQLDDAEPMHALDMLGLRR